MNKRNILLVTILLLSLHMVGCSDIDMTTTVSEKQEETIPLTYTADFYDNNGGRWLSVKGKTFAIEPNKIKTYSWDSSGSWISSYEMSSVVSISIDGKDIESCGSTVIFADDRLEKGELPSETVISTDEVLSSNTELQVSHSSDVRIEDWYKIQHWWYQKSLNNDNPDSRIVVIQSQLGEPICMYSGNEVIWDIPKNLPKTTLIEIDGMPIYIHRANFAIIDTDLLK